MGAVGSIWPSPNGVAEITMVESCSVKTVCTEQVDRRDHGLTAARTSLGRTSLESGDDRNIRGRTGRRKLGLKSRLGLTRLISKNYKTRVKFRQNRITTKNTFRTRNKDTINKITTFKETFDKNDI